MIKFNCLIHKETGAVIKYEDWKEKLESGGKLGFFEIKTGEWTYNPKEMLFNDDFEIIYDSEFTTEKLELIKESLEHSLDEDLIDANGYDIIKDIRNLLNERYILKSNLGIEV